MQNQPQKSKKGCLFLLAAIVGISVLAALFSDDKKSSTSGHVNEKQEARRKKIEAAFSPWDGSHRNLVKYVKENMNDPESFDHDKTTYQVYRGDTLLIHMTYRGKNAFGGVVRNGVVAKALIDGQLLEVESE